MIRFSLTGDELNAVINEAKRILIKRPLPLLRVQRVDQNDAGLDISALVFGDSFLAPQAGAGLAFDFSIRRIEKDPPIPRLFQAVVLCSEKQAGSRSMLPSTAHTVTTYSGGGYHSTESEL